MSFLLFAAGLVALIVGAEALVRGASRLASTLGISSLVIGLTVVAFGTSSPELAVSVKSALAGQSGIAVGNVVGSSIFNVLFILGLSALIVPLVVSQQLVRLDVPLVVVLSALTFVFALDGVISQGEGAVLVTGLVVYVGFLIYHSRRTSAPAEEEAARALDAERSGGLTNVVLVVVGLVLLVLGSRWLVDAAVVFAAYLGVSEVVVGLTIVAVGTSLPEVVTSIVAAIRGERDIAVGNVVGSNIFNLLCVLGIASLVAPGGVEVSPGIVRFDLPVMVAVALACLPVFFTGGVISRTEGALLLGYYAAYTAYLLLAATHHDRLPGFQTAMLYFVLPLTGLVLLVAVVRELRARPRSA